MPRGQSARVSPDAAVAWPLRRGRHGSLSWMLCTCARSSPCSTAVNNHPRAIHSHTRVTRVARTIAALARRCTSSQRTRPARPRSGPWHTPLPKPGTSRLWAHTQLRPLPATHPTSTNCEQASPALAVAVAGEHTWKTVRPRRHDPCIRHASMARLNRLAEMECPRRRISASTATAAAEFTGFECLHAVIMVCDSQSSG